MKLLQHWQQVVALDLAQTQRDRGDATSWTLGLFSGALAGIATAMGTYLVTKDASPWALVGTIVVPLICSFIWARIPGTSSVRRLDRLEAIQLEYEHAYQSWPRGE